MASSSARGGPVDRRSSGSRTGPTARTPVTRAPFTGPAARARSGRRMGAPVTGWLLRYEGLDPAREALRETLCALGNGRFASRAAAPESRAGAGHYPGTYAAGVFDRLADDVD